MTTSPAASLLRTHRDALVDGVDGFLPDGCTGGVVALAVAPASWLAAALPSLTPRMILDVAADGTELCFVGREALRDRLATLGPRGRSLATAVEDHVCDAVTIVGIAGDESQVDVVEFDHEDAAAVPRVKLIPLSPEVAARLEAMADASRKRMN